MYGIVIAIIKKLAFSFEKTQHKKINKKKIWLI